MIQGTATPDATENLQPHFLGFGHLIADWRPPRLDMVRPLSFSRLICALEAFLQTATGWWLTFFVLCGLLLVPLAIADFPPILDYPNHLARWFILARAEHDAILDRIWEPHWAVIPDLGADLLAPTLLRWLGPFAAGKVILALALLTPMFGAVIYSRALFRERLYWPLSAALSAYNLLFLLGFINYLVSLGGALASAGVWLRLRNGPLSVRIITGSACACGLFFVHLFGVAYFGLLVGAAELSAIIPQVRSKETNYREIRSAVFVLVGSFAGPFILMHLAARSPHTVMYGWELPLKLLFLAGPFMAYHAIPGLLAATAFSVAVGAWLSARSATLGPGTAAIVLVLLVGYVVLPFAIGGGTFVDSRLPLMLVLVLSAGLRPRGCSSTKRRCVAGIVSLGFAIAWVSVALVLASPNVEAAELRASIADVPPGSRVLVVSPQPEAGVGYWQHASVRVLAIGMLNISYQLPALLVIDRHAFWPLLFSDPSQHPIRVRPPYDALSVPQGVPPDIRSLTAERSLDPKWPAPYLANWPERYDFVLVINAGAVPKLQSLLPANLESINHSRFAALFRVRRAENAAQGRANAPE